MLVIIGALLLGMLLAALRRDDRRDGAADHRRRISGLSHVSWSLPPTCCASTVSTPLWASSATCTAGRWFFQAAIVIFLIGSALSACRSRIIELIAFRAVQGLGGGGLIVGAQTIVGDIVPPRQRGRYQGIFGATFGSPGARPADRAASSWIACPGGGFLRTSISRSASLPGGDRGGAARPAAARPAT